VSLNQFKTRLALSSAFSEISRLWQDSSGISLKNTSGSYISFLSYCLIQEKKWEPSFYSSDKEEALYFFNDLENLFNSERGTTLLFYPASYRRPYQIMDSDATSVLQRTEVLDALGKERKKLIVVTYPEAIVEKVIEKKNFEKNNLTISVGEELATGFNG
jgi:transcription-repair coupling factor (superfamily II helicase)